MFERIAKNHTFQIWHAATVGALLGIAGTAFAYNKLDVSICALSAGIVIAGPIGYYMNVLANK